MSINEQIIENCQEISNLIKDVPDMQQSTKDEINEHLERVIKILEIDWCKKVFFQCK